MRPGSRPPQKISESIVVSQRQRPLLNAQSPFITTDAEDSSRPASPAPAKPAAPAAPAAAAPKAQQKPRASPASRGGKYYARGGKPAPKDASAAPTTEDAPVDGQKKFEGGRGARPGRGRGAPRGGRRPFDKHSATGKTDSQKKVHQGWGGDEGNTELKQEQAADADAAAEVAPAAEGEATPAEGATTPRKREEEEEEDNTLTLEQYLAQKKEKEAAVPKIEATRQANEGLEDAFKGAVVISKDDAEADYFVGKAKSAPKAKAKKEDKVYLEIDARFDRPERGAGRGRGRGDRGGDRARGGERRGRGAPRAPRGGRQNGPAAPNVDDQTAFPSLA